MINTAKCLSFKWATKSLWSHRTRTRLKLINLKDKFNFNWDKMNIFFVFVFNFKEALITKNYPKDEFFEEIIGAPLGERFENNDNKKFINWINKKLFIFYFFKIYWTRFSHR